MTTQASLNETMQRKSEFIHFEDRASDHPFVDKVWRCRSERAGSFLSVAANNFEMAITRLGGKSFLTLRGPETTATTLDCPAEGEWIGIRFKVGTFMPRFLPGSLRDHKDVTLPPATGHSFWLNGSALEYPDFDNAETFVKRLAKFGILSRDPIVDDTLLRRPGSYACALCNGTSCDPLALLTLHFDRSNERDMRRICLGREFRFSMWLVAYGRGHERARAHPHLEVAFASQMIKGGHDRAAGDTVLPREVAGRRYSGAGLRRWSRMAART